MRLLIDIYDDINIKTVTEAKKHLVKKFKIAIIFFCLISIFLVLCLFQNNYNT